jgi:hypothetical protein
MKPRWEDAPDWVKWIARDKDGDWWGFKNKPQLFNGIWDDPSQGEVFFLGWVYQGKTGLAYEAEWKESMEQRPDET